MGSCLLDYFYSFSFMLIFRCATIDGRRVKTNQKASISKLFFVLMLFVLQFFGLLHMCVCVFHAVFVYWNDFLSVEFFCTVWGDFLECVLCLFSSLNQIQRHGFLK